jgi:hypothetical protein
MAHRVSVCHVKRHSYENGPCCFDYTSSISLAIGLARPSVKASQSKKELVLILSGVETWNMTKQVKEHFKVSKVFGFDQMLLKVKEQHRIDSAKVLSMSGFQNMLRFGWCGSIDIL